MYVCVSENNLSQTKYSLIYFFIKIENMEIKDCAFYIYTNCCYADFTT